MGVVSTTADKRDKQKRIKSRHGCRGFSVRLNNNKSHCACFRLGWIYYRCVYACAYEGKPLIYWLCLAMRH